MPAQAHHKATIELVLLIACLLAVRLQDRRRGTTR